MLTQDYCARSPESIVVRLARNGDRRAFSELVARRQTWIRNLMRRSCADNALAHDARLCVVLAYHEGMTHDEIASLTDIPVGTLKSHIRRGTLRLREQLAAYAGSSGRHQDA